MFIYYILTSGYDRFINLLMGNKDKKYTNKDVILKMLIFGIILFLSILSAYYIPYIILILMLISK